jgi:hypothetical protein
LASKDKEIQQIKLMFSKEVDNLREKMNKKVEDYFRQQAGELHEVQHAFILAESLLGKEKEYRPPISSETTSGTTCIIERKWSSSSCSQ